MARVNQTKEELEKQLIHQVSFLISSCQSYDIGRHHEAKRVATILRTLFHRTRSCKPLLGQLKMQSLPFLDTASPYDPENLVSLMGLTSFKFTPGRLPCLIPKGTQDKNVFSEFDQWWSKPVMVSVSRLEKKFYSRKNLVLNVAETDGGAHVDPGLEEFYNELSRQNGLGVNAIYNGVKYPLLYPELPSLRQIGHEVLITLKRNIPEIFKEEYNEEIEFVPFGEEIGNIDPENGAGLEIYVRNMGPLTPAHG